MSRVSGVSRTEQIAADPNRVIIFDTTMRDGEQAPGFSMSAQAKVKMAQVLRDLGVDVIEAGFAAASPGDEDCIRRVTGEVEGLIFCSLSRANEKDIDASFRALQPAPKADRRCHVFLATSPIHRAAKLKMSTNEVLSTAVRSVEYAASLFDDVIELDGGQHHDAAGLARDQLRTAHLERQGLEVLRFSNLDVLQNLDDFLTELLRRIEARAPHPSPLPNGEREPE